MLGYTATTGPRIASICARYVSKRLKQRKVEAPKERDAISTEKELVKRLVAAIKGGVRLDGFAMVCGSLLCYKADLVIILGGRKALEGIFRRTAGRRISGETITFIASFTSALAGITYWHASRPRKRTVDLTLAALVRAIDVIVQNAWSRRKNTSRIESWVKREIDTIVFAVSGTIIMFAWFYAPERLPKYFP